MPKVKKIVLTGGHAATVALATVEEIKKRRLNWEIYWIGPYSALEGEKVLTAAEQALKKEGVRIVRVVAGRAKKRGPLLLRFWAYSKIPFGFFHSFYWLLRIRPHLVLSFGGFVSLPVAFAAWLLRVPIIIQEQVVGAGLANRLTAPLATKIAIPRRETGQFFPKRKTVLIGNPQVASLFDLKKKNRIGHPPTLYVTGGSTGAVAINRVVEKILPRLLGEYRVIHQTGQRNFKHFQAVRRELEKKLAARYKIFGYKSPKEIAGVFSQADIVVSRAGGNTVADIVNARRPAILIPIPWAIRDEQNKNAAKAVKTGLALILPQDKLTPESLWEKISQVEKNWQQMVDDAQPGDFALDKEAADRLVSLVEETVK